MTKKLIPQKMPPANEPAGWEPADVSAIQAMMEGRANDIQQRRAMEWIINKASMAGASQFRPGGADGERETNFALGRAFVGQQILGLVKINLTAVLNDEKPMER